MTDLIAIDPGEYAGVALFLDDQLAETQLVVNAPYRGWVWPGPYGIPVVCEVPQKYTGSPVDMKNLLTLAFTAGYLVSSMQPSKLTRVFPREWKGQRPKNVDNKWTLRLLSDQERHILEVSNIPKAKMDNVLDAVGIGLWQLGRR